MKTPAFPSPAERTKPDSNENKTRVAVHSQSTQDADEMSADKAGLEPCPFCGGEQPYVWIYRDKTVISALTPEWHVHCKSCNIQISATRKGEAISRWNTRPSGSAELREALPAVLMGTVSHKNGALGKIDRLKALKGEAI